MNLFIKFSLGLLLLSFFFFSYSAEQAKYQLIVFEGSDWCANCKRLEKEILSDSLFLKEVESLAILIKRIDFPQRKKMPKETQQYNNSLAEKYDFNGSFPSLILVKTGTMNFSKISYSNQTSAEILDQIKMKIEILNEGI